MGGNAIYRWVFADDQTYDNPRLAPKLYDVGILADGSLHNPNGYRDDVVRARVQAANERLRQRRSEAAKKAAVTRRERQERKVYRVVADLRNSGKLPGPRGHCYICGKGLDDPESIERGIGSDCWQAVLSTLGTRS
jgi:hypothetical protein